MKKIVISSNTSWSIYNFRLNLARFLKQKGYKIIIVAPYDGYSQKLEKEFDYYDLFINKKGTNPVEDFRTLIAYYEIYKAIKPDVALHFTIKPNIYGTIAANLLGIKSINTMTGLGSLFIEETFITKIAIFLYKFSLSRSSKIFFQNKDDLNLFLDRKLVDKSKCDVLPGSGVDTDKFKPVQIRKNGDKFFRFLLIARMIWDKGIGEYVKAAEILKKKFKNVKFQLLGPLNIDNPSAIPEQQIREWEKRGIVEYLGVTDDVRKFIAVADCVVLPSYYREGIPRSLLEAMAMAKPIITTDTPGCRETIINNVNGFIVKPKDVESLSMAMEKMVKLSPKKREEMGLSSRRIVLEKFDEKIVINKYWEALEMILHKNSIYKT